MSENSFSVCRNLDPKTERRYRFWNQNSFWKESQCARRKTLRDKIKPVVAGDDDHWNSHQSLFGLHMPNDVYALQIRHRHIENRGREVGVQFQNPISLASIVNTNYPITFLFAHCAQ